MIMQWIVPQRKCDLFTGSPDSPFSIDRERFRKPRSVGGVEEAP